MSDPINVGGKVASGLPRLRTCLRCESTADAREQAGMPKGQVNEAQSWVRSSVRYWSGTCSGCAARERQQREDARFAQEKENRR